ncbi:MAG TPA: rhombosortase [Gammaproteobacteria bacterium]|nr:rhombosortase [Gammaproteobacteria bacterium]HCK94405.1 rhombosortase [Gammaproteobacteria bacterium]
MHMSSCGQQKNGNKMASKISFYLHLGLALIMTIIQCLTMVFDKKTFAMLPFSHLNHEYWRVITGHLVHTNLQHCILNLTGLGFIYYAFVTQINWKESFSILIILMLGISLCLGLFDKMYYYGFSAVLHGYLGFLLIRYWRAAPKMHSVLLLAVILKVVLENTGNLSSVDTTSALIDAPVATQSHAYGLTIGLLSGFFMSAIHKWRSKDVTS